MTSSKPLIACLIFVVGVFHSVGCFLDRSGADDSTSPYGPRYSARELLLRILGERSKESAETSIIRRFPSRKFDSDLPLRVYVEPPVGKGPLLGSTPTPQPLEIPECDFWYVQPSGPLSDNQWEALVCELTEKEIPGLELPEETKDEDLNHISKLKNLRVLNLRSAHNIGDAGLVHVASLTNLEFLVLRHTKITDAGLEHLKVLTNLVSLRLNSTRISDKGLKALVGLSNLTGLDLSQTKVTDAGLVYLEQIPTLLFVDLAGTKVTPTGVKRLKAALPGMLIET